jgi:hypothetical protein
MSDFWRSRFAIARKTHVCDECRCPIAIGHRYERFAGSQEGDFYSIAYHPECRAHALHINADNDYPEDWRSIREWIDEGGVEMLDDAPDIVRARFGLPVKSLEVTA